MKFQLHLPLTVGFTNASPCTVFFISHVQIYGCSFVSCS